MILHEHVEMLTSESLDGHIIELIFFLSEPHARAAKSKDILHMRLDYDATNASPPPKRYAVGAK
jgi:hypothetical protein